MLHLLNVLKDDILEFVVTARCKTLNEIIEVAYIKELQFESPDHKKKITQSSSQAI